MLKIIPLGYIIAIKYVDIINYLLEGYGMESRIKKIKTVIIVLIISAIAIAFCMLLVHLRSILFVY